MDIVRKNRESNTLVVISYRIHLTGLASLLQPSAEVEDGGTRGTLSTLSERGVLDYPSTT